MPRYIVVPGKMETARSVPKDIPGSIHLPLVDGFVARLTDDERTDLANRGFTVVEEDTYSIPTPVEEPSIAAGGGDYYYPTVELDPSIPGNMNMMVTAGVESLIAKGITGKGVTIGIADTGIDPSHPDLSNDIAAFKDFIHSDQSPKDPSGHGTGVASFAAGTGIVVDKFHGVAPDANVMMARVMDGSGNGREADIILGLGWLDESGAEIINLSLGSMIRRWSPLSEAVQKLADKGRIVTTAAGNDGPRTITSPANAYGCICVAACDEHGRYADFSSVGPAMGRDREDVPKPDITAWGHHVAIARSIGTSLGKDIHKRYVAVSGTSFSAPFVAGAAALYKQAVGNITTFKTDLIITADDDPNTDHGHEGAGRIQIERAIEKALGGPVPTTIPPGAGGCLLGPIGMLLRMICIPK